MQLGASREDLPSFRCAATEGRNSETLNRLEVVLARDFKGHA